MFTKKFIIASLISLGMASSTCIAAEQSNGKAAMVGSIISTQPTCSISPESLDQAINFGQISDAALLTENGSGKSTPRPFSIDLENCDVGGGNSVSVTFSGMEGKNGRLGITGTASGASIAFTDDSGDVLALGKPSKSFKLNEGNNTLRFTTYLQGDGVPGNIKPGDYQAVADFTLSYQ
ncbi:fimbrial protein [Serratia nematodiphila]|uniref:fimbrial protein n=1 Tax=Serratia nematodiphila TaxID=458197 RepID=UPI0011D34BBC|nr:fimbrial protein [Serratia nematodiphila]TXE64593.1 type 1 fimbrial protein [Serratia nematodiphila]